MALYCKKCKEEISRTQYDFYSGYCKNCYGKKEKKSKNIHKINESKEDVFNLIDFIGDLIDID